MQLNTSEGYRNLQCTACHKQSRCKFWTCAHGIPWHECDVHRQDPSQHLTTRGVKRVDKPAASSLLLLPSSRAGPVVKLRKVPLQSVARGIKRIHSGDDIRLVEGGGLYSLNPEQCPRLAAKFARSSRFVQPHIVSASSSSQWMESESSEMRPC